MTHLNEEEKSYVEPILEILSQNLRPLNVHDSSCFYTSGDTFKLIDFALWDASKHEWQLYDCETLTNQQKNDLRAQVRN